MGGDRVSEVHGGRNWDFLCANLEVSFRTQVELWRTQIKGLP